MFDGFDELPQVVRDLIAAKAVIENDGWTQGVAHDDDGTHCVVGAVWIVTDCEAAGVVFNSNTREQVCYDALLDTCGGSPITWNDAAGRTLAEVLDMYDRTIVHEIAKAKALVA